MVFYNPRAQARRVGQGPTALNNAQLSTQIANNPNMFNAQALNAQALNAAPTNQFANPAEPPVASALSGDLANFTQSTNNMNVLTGVDKLNGANETIIQAAPNVQVAVVETPTAPAPVAPVAQCEFPAQGVVLERTVNITNTPPQLQNIETDVCGNVISYTETMTRNMTAGPWVPVSGLTGPVDNFADVNGVIQSTNFHGNVKLANSPGLQSIIPPPTPTTVQGPLVGGRQSVFASNNRIYGASAMKKFRSA